MAVTSGPTKLQRMMMMDESGCEPDYDELEERPPPARSWCLPRQPLRRNISVLDRLILSHPVWLQLTVNPAKAMHILQKEPCGAFLVRRSSTIQKKILSVRLSSEEGSCFVKDFAIIETQSTFSLEGSSISFADLFRLIAFYCVSRDVLPFTLKLPHAIDTATSAKELEAISHLGIEFWNSSRNQRKAERGAAGAAAGPNGGASVRTRAPCQLAMPKGRALCFINPLFLEEHTEGASLRRAWGRSAAGVRVSTETGTSQLSPPPRPPPPVPRRRGSSNDGAGSASHNGNDLRRSLSGEGGAGEVAHRAGSSDASGAAHLLHEPPNANSRSGGCGGGGSYDIPKAPIARPVPPPRLKKLSSSPVEKKPLSTQGRVAKVGWVTEHVEQAQPERAPSEEKRLGSEDARAGYQIPHSSEHAYGGSCFLTNGNELCADDQGSDTLSNELLSDDQSLFDFIAGKVPAIPELDSASMSSMEEDDDDDDEEEEEEEEGVFGEVLEVDETESSYHTPPALRRSTALALRGKVRSSFRKFSEVLHLLLTPERRVVRKIVELAQEKRSYFCSLLQDYITFIQDTGSNYQSSSDLLQAVRQLLNQLKAYLLHTHELDPPIESLIPDSNIDAVIEKALHKCLLKPLKPQVDAWMRDFRSSDGSARRLRENLQLARESSLADFGAGGVGGGVGGAGGAGGAAAAAARLPNVPDAACLERIRVTLGQMQATYSPSKKVLLLLKACKFIYDAMGSGLGTMFGADDFMPVLMYVLARCDMPFLDMEVEYMMELLDPSLLSGEGGYYLTTVYGALFLLKNYHQEEAGWRLKTDARDSLRQWHRRRTVNNKDLPSFDDIQNFIRVAFQDSGCTGKTLSTHPYATTDEVCRLCAEKFRVPDAANFGLFLLVDGTWQQLAGDTHPLKIKAELHSKERLQPFFFIYRRLGTSPLPSPGP